MVLSRQMMHMKRAELVVMSKDWKMEIKESVLNGDTMLRIVITTTMKQCMRMAIGQDMKMDREKDRATIRKNLMVPLRISSIYMK